MSKNWPFWRTNPDHSAYVTTKLLVLAGLATFFGPLITSVLGFLAMRHFGLADIYLFQILAVVQIVVVYGAFASWIFILIATFLARLAVRKGYGGWGVALCTGIALPLCVFALVPFTGLLSQAEMILYGIGSGIGHAMVFWMIIRLNAPAAFN